MVGVGKTERELVHSIHKIQTNNTYKTHILFKDVLKQMAIIDCTNLHQREYDDFYLKQVKTDSLCLERLEHIDCFRTLPKAKQTDLADMQSYKLVQMCTFYCSIHKNIKSC